MLGDKQITSVGIFDVVAFYTLFRVHLTLIIVCICPQKGALLFLFRFSMLGWEICRNRHFWTCFGTNGKQRNSAVEESSNETSQDKVSRNSAEVQTTTASPFKRDAVKINTESGLKCYAL